MQKHLNSIKRKSSEGIIGSTISLFLINFLIHIFIFIVITIISFLSALKFDLIYPVSLLSVATSNFISGILSGYIKRQKGLINGILFSLPSNVIFIILSLLTNKFLSDYKIIISVIVAFFFSAIGGIISVNYKRRVKIRH